MISKKLTISQLIEINDPIEVTLHLPQIQDRTVTFFSHVKYVYKNRILFSVPDQMEVQVFIQAGNPVELNFEKVQPNIPIIKTTILRYQTDGLTGCWVDVPLEYTETIFKQRRSHLRVPIRCDVKVTYKTLEETVTSDAESQNLSGGGMRILSNVKFYQGQRILLEFQPDKRFPPFKLEGEVVSCEASPYKTSRFIPEIVTAIKFVNVLPYQEDRLVGACFRKELEQQKHLQRD